MKIAVIQHALKDSARDDAAALLEASRRASEAGAELVVLPVVPSLESDEAERERLYESLAEMQGVRFVPHSGIGHAGTSYVAEPIKGLEQLGRPALLVGDSVLDKAVWREVLAAEPSFAVLCPRSENDLQSEGALELGIALSDSLAGLIMIAECDGAESGQSGHGGSAIIVLGDLMAEALGGDEVLMADVTVPIPQPEPRESLPALPTILSQRLSRHRGQKPTADYLADLSGGPVPD